MPRTPQPSREPNSLPAFDLTEAPWPGAEAGCPGCELTQEAWEYIFRMMLEGRDVHLLDDTGYSYPIELRHLTTGPAGLSEMLGLVKQDARAAHREGHHEHSHTTHARPR